MLPVARAGTAETPLGGLVLDDGPIGCHTDTQAPMLGK